MALALQKCVLLQNFQLMTPKSLGLHFCECQWKQKICVSHYEKLENWL